VAGPVNRIASAPDSRLTDPANAAPAVEQPGPGARERVAYIEYLRGLAIVLIVCGHTYALAWGDFVDEDPRTKVSWLNVVPAIITGGTAYFVFISGFLYRHVFFGRVSYGDFLRRKALVVGLPYLVLAMPLALAAMSLGAFTMTAAKGGGTYDRSTFLDFLVLVSTGRMIAAYWYIPFIFVGFLASPLFDRFIGQPRRWRAAVLAASIGLALWVARPAGNLSPVHSVLYFANLYLFGIVFCEHREAIMRFLARPVVIAALFVMLFAIAATQAMVLQSPGNLERLPTDGWGPVGFDLMLVQKYVGILAFCAALSRWGDMLAGPLTFLADHSFGLFFTHGVAIAILMRMPVRDSLHVGEPMADLAICSLFVFTLSMAMVMVVRRMTGTYSRYVIGC
jgi:fucose 4-O-acetylase-like acetyltransferase